MVKKLLRPHGGLLSGVDLADLPGQQPEPIAHAAEPIPELPDGFEWLDVRLLVRTSRPLTHVEHRDMQRDISDALDRALDERGLAPVGD